MNKAPLKRWRARTNHLIAAGLLTCAGCNSVWDSWLMERGSAGDGGGQPPDLLECRLSVSTYRPQMIPIPTGTFQMGTADLSTGFSDETQHLVKINTPFWLSETEVTQGQYLALMPGHSFVFKDLADAQNRPADNVRWFDAIDYCNALSQKEGLEPCYERNGNDVTWKGGLGCKGYRLPTEAEWEYAARANDGTTYAGSNNPDEVAWYNTYDTGTTQPVKGKKPNGWGLFDMSGNVWEWVWDFYLDYTMHEGFNAGTPVVNPLGPSSGTGRIGARGYRGGAWSITDLKIMRLANRRYEQPDFLATSTDATSMGKPGNLGFRIAKTIDPAVATSCSLTK